jgi:predicted RNA-binding Zn ribbon-like protein
MGQPTTERAQVAGEQPGGRRPAPGRLALVQAFVNTCDIEGGTDALATPEELTRWLRSAGLVRRDVRADGPDLTAALELREALRSLLLANNDGAAAAKAWEVLNETAEAARLRLRFSAKAKPLLEPQAPGVAGALGVLVAIVAAAIADGSWYRLKACRRDACRWAFYDHSQAQASVWCSMSICGNRTKVHRHRQRAGRTAGRRR